MPSDYDRTVRTSLRNWGPWSESIFVGHPWGKITFRRSVVAMVEAAMSGRGSASHHLVRYFVINRMYLFPLVDDGKEPMRSHPINLNSWETGMGCRWPSFCGTIFICWHVGMFECNWIHLDTVWASSNVRRAWEGLCGNRGGRRGGGRGRKIGNYAGGI